MVVNANANFTLWHACIDLTIAAAYESLLHMAKAILFVQQREKDSKY